MQLPLSTPLGSYPDQEEFQVDRALVWVTIKPGANRSDCVAKANAIFADIWAAIPAAAACAESASRRVMPKFWEEHDRANTSGKQLAVWGVWINPEDKSAEYEVNVNHDFDPSRYGGVPGYPEGLSFMVKRDSNGVMQVRILRDD